MDKASSHSPPKWTSPLAHDPNDNSETNPLEEIFKGNRAWVKAHDPEFFASSAKRQSPRYLWIGCSDSRVPAEEITGLPPGRLFVHRNIANMVIMTDANVLSVLEYAVNVLCVQDIIVCGHYGCGGVRSALEKCDSGILGNWLCNIRDVHRTHHDDINELGNDQENQLRLLVELNVREQCINLLKTATVQKSLLKTRRPRIHGVVYDLADGVIHELQIDFHKIADDLGEIYSLYT